MRRSKRVAIRPLTSLVKLLVTHHNAKQEEFTCPDDTSPRGESAMTSQLEISSGEPCEADTSPDRSSTLSKTSDTSAGNKLTTKQPSYRSPKNKSRNEKFHRRFKNVPESDEALKAYSCAYFGDILLQGYIYISRQYFCFYSKILGHEKQIEISIGEVLNLTRERTAIIIPNAIGIVTAKDKYVFGSLLSRDSTYRMMWNVWKQVKQAQLASVMADNFPSPGSNGFIQKPDQAPTDNNNVLKKSMTEGELSMEMTESSGTVSEASICMDCGTPLSDHGQDSRCTTYRAEVERGGRDKPHGKDREGRHLEEEEEELDDGTVTNDNAATKCDEPISDRVGSDGAELTPKSSAVRNARIFSRKFMRENLLLSFCSAMVISLLILALVMSYKLIVLENHFTHSSPWTSDTILTQDQTYSDVYYLNNQYHMSTLHRFHSILEANIQILSQVHESLRYLQEAVDSETASCPKS